ncbi:MAG: STAS domain-containing protein [Bacteroidales bacterium]|nr:STAS domain-containing protein [Bacteroidales bacterium]
MDLFTIEKKDDIVIIHFKEDIKKFNALITEEAKKQLNALFDAPNTKLILSLKGIKYVDSSGFGVLLSLMKTANNKYGFLKICDVSDEVMELFKLLQLHNIFDIEDNVEDCLKNFSAS